MAPRDPRLHLLESAVEWYRAALDEGASETLELAAYSLYQAHGAPLGEATPEDRLGLLFWFHFETWTTAN